MWHATMGHKNIVDFKRLPKFIGFSLAIVMPLDFQIVSVISQKICPMKTRDNVLDKLNRFVLMFESQAH